MSTKPTLSAKAEQLIRKHASACCLWQAALLSTDDTARPERCHQANVKMEEAKRALDAYVLRLERTVHRTRNELKAVSAKQRGMATETCLTFVVIGVLLLFGAITAVVERSMKHRQDHVKPSVDCVRPAPSKVYL